MLTEKMHKTKSFKSYDGCIHVTCTGGMQNIHVHLFPTPFIKSPVKPNFRENKNLYRIWNFSLNVTFTFEFSLAKPWET